MTQNKTIQKIEQISEYFRKSSDRNDRQLKSLHKQIKTDLIGQGITVGLGAMALIAQGVIIRSIIPKHYSLNEERKIEQRINSSDIRTYQQGNGVNTVKFHDYNPFGSLDEVVRIQNGKPEILRVGDKGFNEYIKDWKPYRPF